MSAHYNDYVLSTALEHGWVSPETHAAVTTILAEHPDVSALEYMQEHQLLEEKYVNKFREAIAEADASHAAPAEAVAVAETAPAEAHVPTARVAGTPRVVSAKPQVAVTSHENYKHVDEFLRLAQEWGASDIHLGVGMPPMMRRYGTLQPMWEGAATFTPADTQSLTDTFLDEQQINYLKERGDCDFCYAKEGLGRFRTSVVRQRRGMDLVFRIIESKVRSMDDLGLPDGLKQLTQYNNGIVLVTGAVGSGKSTTMAALINEVNHTRHDHIITLEDPIEYRIDSAHCHVTQREIHNHTRSFASALRASLREDPDVIMVGEMRDLETISLAITAAETGHLVFSTLHTANAARTLDRVLDVFPVDQQDQIRVMVSESLRGIISQQLIPRADGQGRVMALEILVNTPAVAALIRDGKTFMLPGVMQTGRKVGMKLMDDSLMDLYKQGLITKQEAGERAENKALFK